MELTVTSIDKFKVIKPFGRVDWENARVIDREIQHLIDEGHCNIVLNLDDITFICSGGIGALVYNHNKMEKIGGAIYIIADNEYVQYIFEMLKFDIAFEGYLYKKFEDFSAAVLDKAREA